MEYQTHLENGEGWSRLPRVFSKEDINRLLIIIENADFYLKNDWGEFMRKRDKCIIMCMYHLCLRPNEALSLRFSDFDIQSFYVSIRPETNKERLGKTVPVPTLLIPYLEDYLSLPRSRFWGNSECLFPSFADKLKSLSAGRWKGRFRQILKSAGLWLPPQTDHIRSVPYSSYTLRHSKCTHVYEKTHDIFQVKEMAGHRKLSSSLRYIHLSKNHLENLRTAMS